MDTFLYEARSRFGSSLIPRQDFIFELMARAGQARAYALIADQTPRKTDAKVWTRFLQQDTAFFVGAGMIAKFLDAEVLYVEMRRVRRGYYSVRFTVLAEPPYEELEDALIVERYAAALERQIRESPADWLWLQKKWKYAKPSPESGLPAASPRRGNPEHPRLRAVAVRGAQRPGVRSRRGHHHQAVGARFGAPGLAVLSEHLAHIGIGARRGKGLELFGGGIEPDERVVRQSVSHTMSRSSTHTAYVRALPGSFHSRQA